MKFLLSIPFQLIVVIFVAVTVSSVVSKPLKPLTSALSITPSNATASADQASVAPPAIASISFIYWPIVVALAAALATFVLWHLYRFYRSELAIQQAKKAGGRITASKSCVGIWRYIFSDISISFADRDLSRRKLPELHQIHNLTRLDLSGCGISQKSLAKIVYCRFLEEVDLSRNPLSREALLKFRRKTTAKLLHSS